MDGDLKPYIETLVKDTDRLRADVADLYERDRGQTRCIKEELDKVWERISQINAWITTQEARDQRKQWSAGQWIVIACAIAAAVVGILF